jgi:hypothetical protein
VLETVISVFSALGAFGNVAFLTVSAGFGRFAGRDVRSQGQMVADRSRRAGKRARRQAAVRSTRVRRRAMPNAERAQLLASKLDRAKVRRGSAVAGVSAALAMSVAQRGRFLHAAGRLRARRGGADGGADGGDREDVA